MLNRLLIGAAAGMMLYAGLVNNSQAATRFAVFADPHYYDTDLGTEGEAFEAYLAQDRKLIRESGAILSATIDALIEEHQNEPLDFVIVPGDLTKDGALSSHQEFAAMLSRLETAGIPVYVAPGNHDLNNPHAMAYEGDTATPVANVTPEEFMSIYAEFGYGEALIMDADSLSYSVEPVPGLVMLSLDSCKYDDNIASGTPETGGAFSASTEAWVLSQVENARAAGKQVVAFEHHGILEHYDGQSLLFGDYVIDDWERLSASFASAGLELVFTGHFHSNDITGKTWEDTGAEIYDVETGSLVTAPCPYRIVTLHGGNAAQIETRHVEEIDYDTGELSFQEYAAAFLYEGLLALARDMLVGEYGLPEKLVSSYLAPIFADALVAHYSGDEQPNDELTATIEQLLAADSAVVRFLGKTLYALWNDQFPTDNRALLSLDPVIRLEPAGTYASGIFDEGASEIVAFDSRTARLLVSNADADTVEVLDASDPENPSVAFTIDLSPYGAGVNSVAVKDGLVAVAVEADPKQDPGVVAFFTVNGRFLNQVSVGALPDMLTFTPDGKRVVVANEGEPNDDYSVDPEGSISIIDLSRGVKRAKVRTADFSRFNGYKDRLVARGVRIFGPDATVAQDLEPEYITVDAEGRFAYVTLQENNAVARVNLNTARVTNILPMGVKDLGRVENAFDASDEDGAVTFATYENVFGLYLPDAIAGYLSGGSQYLVTANEGDSRDYDAFSEEERVKDLVLDPTTFPNSEELQEKKVLGRLKVTTTMGDENSDGLYEKLFTFGGRSFSILKLTRRGLQMVFESGKQLEEITASALPFDFNSTNGENGSFDDRSDDKGPEPEGLTIGAVCGRLYLFVGLERVSGIMVYDITHPESPVFVQYMNNRNFAGDPEQGTAGDLAPEGLTFISADQSPSGLPLLAVANEVSGSTTLYTIQEADVCSATD